MQCNAFKGEPSLAVTAGGGRRVLPFLWGKSEDLGMIGVHHEGRFYELVPWAGQTSWSVDAWGRWALAAENDDVVCELVVECPDQPGQVLRAPTEDGGLQPFCRDSMLAHATLSLWEKNPNGSRGTPIVDAATSDVCGVEVGGGPWWGPWEGTSRMRQPLRLLLRGPRRARSWWRARRRGGAGVSARRKAAP